MIDAFDHMSDANHGLYAAEYDFRCNTGNTGNTGNTSDSALADARLKGIYGGRITYRRTDKPAA